MNLEPLWFTQDKYMKDVAKELKRLEDLLFAAGAMEDLFPCFCCGYNGPGYYQSETHPCATRHHKLTHNDVKEI